MKAAIRFGLKSYFGGCLGCLGVLSLVLVLAIILGVVVGPELMSGLPGILQAIPGMLMQGQSPLGGETPGGPANIGPVPPMEVFLTNGEDPEGQHITSFTKEQSSQVYFWVRTPKDTSIRFALSLTLPDGRKVQFGPPFLSDPSGNAVNCGQFGDADPLVGNYKLEAVPVGSLVSGGAIEFTITE